MTDLSPQAQAVLDAYMNNCGWLDGPLDRDYRCVAAVLRAATDRARRGPEHWEGSYPDDYDNGWNEAVDYLTTIATELENQ